MALSFLPKCYLVQAVQTEIAKTLRQLLPQISPVHSRTSTSRRSLPTDQFGQICHLSSPAVLFPQHFSIEFPHLSTASNGVALLPWTQTGCEAACAFCGGKLNGSQYAWNWSSGDSTWRTIQQTFPAEGCEILQQLMVYPSIYGVSTCFNRPVGDAGFHNHPQ